MDAGHEIQRIRESGVFDEKFYAASYGGSVPPGTDLVRHFVQVGLEIGYKPNPTFDPIVYRMLHPHRGGKSLIIDALTRYRGKEWDLRPRAAFGRIRPVTREAFRPLPNFVADTVSDVAAAEQYGKAGAMEFEIDGASRRILVPSASELLQRLRDDKPFAFVRLSHGDWDCLYVFRHYRRLISQELAAKGLSDSQLDLLASRMCDDYHHREEMYAENFFCELLADLAHGCRDRRFMHAVAFKGYPTADDRPFGWSLIPTSGDGERLRIFSSYFAADEPVYDATAWKRWLIAGSAAALPTLAAERPVILMAAERLGSLGQRWSLPWLLHIPIPIEGSYPLRYNLLAACREKIAEARELARRYDTKSPLFLLQGSSFAYWFVRRLFATDNDIFYIDTGQALHAWFYDMRDIPLLPWGRIYGPTIVRNCGLEGYYRDLGIKEPVTEALFAGRSG